MLMIAVVFRVDLRVGIRDAQECMMETRMKNPNLQQAL